MADKPPYGLSTAEVEGRVRRGQVNRTRRSDWRDYAQICSRNLLTWFNAMVTPAAIALQIQSPRRLEKRADFWLGCSICGRPGRFVDPFPRIPRQR